jgi:predicted Zn finger-like uncharacterized protein
MFTRCPNCRTVFHITAAELRAAEGTVVCGACGTTFDALESLSETRPKDPPIIGTRPSAEPGPAPGPEPEPEPPIAAPASAENAEEARDEDEFLQELESLIGTESFFEEPGPAPDSAGAGTPPMASSPEPLRDEELATGVSTGDGTLDEVADEDEEEFLVEDFGTGLADEESRFDEALITDEPLPDGDGESAPGMDRSPGGAPDDELDDPFLDPDSVFRIDDMEEDAADAAQREADADAVDAATAGGADGEPEPQRPDGRGDFAAQPGWRIEPDADTPADEESEGGAETPQSAETLPEFAQEDRPRRGWLRLAVVLIAVILLAGTWAHGQRGKLLRHPAGEAVLGPVYALLGMEVAPDWNPAAFRALQWQAIADADRPDDLTVAVSFMNMASYPQPYPVIRIVLEDRFGRRVGMHDVPPAQYLADHSRGSRMAGGGRLQTTVVVRDPGGQADGFRVDFCLELEGRGMVCGPEPFR